MIPPSSAVATALIALQGMATEFGTVTEGLYGTLSCWRAGTLVACIAAAVARVLADRSYSAQYGRQQVGAQRRQIGEIEGVTDVTTVPPGREQARAAQDSEVAGNLRG